MRKRWLIALMVIQCGAVWAADPPLDDLQQARQWRAQGERAKAIAVYDRILEANPADADALVGRGFAHSGNPAQYEQALRDFDAAIRVAPDYADAYIGRAVVLRRMDRRRQAWETLEEARLQLGDNEEVMRYLAESAWREAFFMHARRWDREFPPSPGRVYTTARQEVILNTGYDWLDNRSDWQEVNVTYRFRPRPDQSVFLYYSDFYRNKDKDFLAGVGYLFRHSGAAAVALDAYFSDDSGFTARQKYHPRVILGFPYGVELTAGARFEEFADGWARVSHTELRKYHGPYYLKYALLAGEDNTDRSVTTHGVEAGWEREQRIRLRAGFASGNESLERTDRFIDATVDVDTYYIGGRYYVTPDWGVDFAVSREYRDDDFFRNSGSLGVFYQW